MTVIMGLGVDVWMEMGTVTIKHIGNIAGKTRLRALRGVGVSVLYISDHGRCYMCTSHVCKILNNFH